MKFKDHTLFLITALILFFPIGIVFIILSTQSAKRKWLLSILGLLASILLFSAAFLPYIKQDHTTDIEIIATRQELSVGQSGGFSVITSNAIATEFEVYAQNEILTVHDNVYTAIKPGKCELKIICGNSAKSIEISVTEGNRTDETVYASPSANRYHSRQTHAGKRAFEMTEEDALQSGKTPCMVCYK